MKKKIILFTSLFVFALIATAQESIVKEVFEQFVEDKVSSMQEVIDINDEQANKLKELELNFLMDVNSAENCFWCNSKKRIKKLNRIRNKNLQEILTQEQYIKYNVIDNKLINKEIPVQV